MAVQTGVAVLRLDEVPGPAVDNWLATMPVGVQERARGFRSQRRYRQFVAARRLLATLLGEPLGYLPTIVGQAGGKPRVEGTDIHCSIAHSGGTVMAGFSLLAPIGVDVEEHRPRQFERLVMTYFHPHEQKVFAALEAAARAHWFYRMWTRKEACAKVSGEGLTLRGLASLEQDGGDDVTLSSGCFEGCAVAVAHSCSAPVAPRLACYADGEIDLITTDTLCFSRCQ